MSKQIKCIKIWINAFIPRVVTNYTKNVPAGIHKGKTMIPGPVLGISDCYLTDQRSFSNLPTAKSRMHSAVDVHFTQNKITLTQTHRCDRTTELDCEDGDVECSEIGSTTRMKFTLKSSTSTTATISFRCAANNPCSPSSRLFGDIDFHGTLNIDINKRQVVLDGMFDSFPAFESYISINNGNGIKIMQESPPAGNTVKNLPGNANRRMLRSARF